jgi:hypothetical protein
MEEDCVVLRYWDMNCYGSVTALDTELLAQSYNGYLETKDMKGVGGEGKSLL